MKALGLVAIVLFSYASFSYSENAPPLLPEFKLKQYVVKQAKVSKAAPPEPRQLGQRIIRESMSSGNSRELAQLRDRLSPTWKFEIKGQEARIRVGGSRSRFFLFEFRFD